MQRWKWLPWLWMFLLSACGDDGKMSTDPALPAFFNQAGVSTDVLGEQWTRAQKHLARQQIYINAATTEAARYLPADARALEVVPHGVYVIALPDAQYGSLPAGVQSVVGADPTGIFFYEGCGCYVYGYVKLGATPHVYVAVSRADRSAAYEFENIILYQLGYDIRDR